MPSSERGSLNDELLLLTTHPEREFLHRLQPLLAEFEAQLDPRRVLALLGAARNGPALPPPIVTLLQRALGLTRPDLHRAHTDDPRPIGVLCDLLLQHLRTHGARGADFGRLATFYRAQLSPDGPSLRRVLDRLLAGGDVIRQGARYIARTEADVVPHEVLADALAFVRRSGSTGCALGDLESHVAATLDADLWPDDVWTTLLALGWVRRRGDRVVAVEGAELLDAGRSEERVPDVLATVGVAASRVASGSADSRLVRVTVALDGTEPGTAQVQRALARTEVLERLPDAGAVHVVVAVTSAG
jgi:hypothetical protein